MKRIPFSLSALSAIVMKPPSVKVILPATAIALGVTAILGQSSYAAEGLNESYVVDESYVPDIEQGYGDTRVQIPDLDAAYQRSAPVSHYAYYSIARPEYLL
jgi:hypothetical protein